MLSNSESRQNMICMKMNGRYLEVNGIFKCLPLLTFYTGLKRLA